MPWHKHWYNVSAQELCHGKRVLCYSAAEGNRTSLLRKDTSQAGSDLRTVTRGFLNNHYKVSCRGFPNHDDLWEAPQQGPGYRTLRLHTFFACNQFAYSLFSWPKKLHDYINEHMTVLWSAWFKYAYTHLWWSLATHTHSGSCACIFCQSACVCYKVENGQQARTQSHTNIFRYRNGYCYCYGYAWDSFFTTHIHIKSIE